MTPAPVRLTLRDLPLPAKLVISTFLISVGIGYLSAMVQLHLKHSSKDGNPLPTRSDVIEHFSGLKPYDPDAEPQKSLVEDLISGPTDEPDVSKTNMAPAFFAKSKGFQKAIDADGKDKVEKQREAERQAMLAWLQIDEAAKKATYNDDAFELPDDFEADQVTADFVDGQTLKIRSLFDARCQNCHNAQAPELGDFAALEPYVVAPSPDLIDGKWIKSNKQTSVEALTQSTHAHLLSFSMLFALTGLTFAFTSYPGFFRAIIGPIVLIAQMADIACWWLARVPDYGPYFAQGIMVTGAIVGIGLTVQIVGSLFNMYGWFGKAVLVLLAVAFAAAIGTVGTKVIVPALEAQKSKAEQTDEADKDKKKQEEESKQPSEEKSDVTELEALVNGPIEGAPWKKGGSMAAAFFHKDGDNYKKELEERGEEVTREREGEQAAVVAWIRSDDSVRKKAFEDDEFELPEELVGKPITAEFLINEKKVKIFEILDYRCMRCHLEGGDVEDYPLETYEQLKKYMQPRNNGTESIPNAKD